MKQDFNNGPASTTLEREGTLEREQKKPVNIPGLIRLPERKFTEEETARRIQERHENNFNANTTTEGSRHGNACFPMDYDWDN